MYGDKTLTSYLNRAAFALPAPGTLGDMRANSVKGPGFWAIDLGMSKLVSLTERQRVEFRVEAFNLLNNFNWGNPNTNLRLGAVRSGHHECRYPANHAVRSEVRVLTCGNHMSGGDVMTGPMWFTGLVWCLVRVAAICAGRFASAELRHRGSRMGAERFGNNSSSENTVTLASTCGAAIDPASDADDGG